MPKETRFNEEEVLKKAMLVFWRKGYHHTSIQDLVDELGLLRGSIYNTFGGKRELFGKAFEYYHKLNHEGLHGFLSTQYNVKEGLRKVFLKIIQDDIDDPDFKGCFVANTTTELVPDDKSLYEMTLRHKEVMVGLFEDFLNFGVREEQISPKTEVRTLAVLLYTFMTGLRVLGKTSPDPAESMASMEAILSLVD